ncbi:MAG: TonB-dependent receptor plug domain-containing protein [Bacteroidales bacterium]|nr:TonB-dependent receptor plug domain-containing protein [Bacteroidales bacterium]
MKHIFLTIFFSLISISAFSVQKEQGVPFNGKIVDLLGNPVRRARIYVDAHYYAISDRKGRFGLTDVKETDTIKVKYQKNVYYIPVAGRKSISIKIADQLDKSSVIEAQEDNDLVSIGYGYVKRRESLDVSNGIPGEVIRRTNAINVLEALRGLVPGLTFRNSGGNTRVIIRGLGTISDETDPLFLVDGVEVENLNGVSIFDVDHVEVLKDGSMYGARGANGVILVRTIGTSKSVF